MSSPSFAPLAPEQLAQDRARRAAAEPEIARKEAALAEAEDRLQAAKAEIETLEAELDASRTPGEPD